MILARHDVRLDQHDKLLNALGAAGGHLTLLDSRVDDHEKRFDRLENDIASSLGRVEAQVAALHGKLDLELESLKQTFIPRTEMPALYISREEHEKRWQMRMQWPTVALAVLMIVSQCVLLLRGVH